jgi:uncharacterized protein (TIGR02145 family)
MKNLLLFSSLISMSLLIYSQTVTDIDGNIYNTVTIGTQVWMKENLKTTKFNDGTDLPYKNFEHEKPWYSWYDDDEVLYGTTYGAFYNLPAVDTTTNNGKNICPCGWHVPTDAEWTTLIDYLGGDRVAGGKMKEEGTDHWASPNIGATNESGFKALPGGNCSLIPASGWFWNIFRRGYWWIHSDNENPNLALRMYSDSINVDRFIYPDDVWPQGYSVRCIKSNNDSIISNCSNVSLISNCTKTLVIYPNPTNETLYFENIKNENFTIIIYDLNGTMVLRKGMISNSIDISPLTDGIFIIKIFDSESAIVYKFLKE